MKKRKMSALQRKYFGKRHKSVARVKRVKQKVVYMARRRSYRGRARSYARKGIGGMKSLIVPVGAGLADRFIDQYTPIDGIGSAAVGILMHNEIVKNIGLYKVGYSLGNILPIPGISGNSGGALL